MGRRWRSSSRPGVDHRFETPNGYLLYDRLADVPPAFFDDSGLVVQKYFAEIDQGMYCVRIMNFLGDRVSCMRLKGRHPIVNGPSTEIAEAVEPHPDIIAAQRRLHFDFGKFDYVMAEGRAVLLDINKTVGCATNLLDNQEMRRVRQHRAAALYEFFR